MNHLRLLKRWRQRNSLSIQWGTSFPINGLNLWEMKKNAKWTERGVLMDVTIKKKDGKTTIGTAKAHPTWVNRTPKGTFSPEGYPLYHYQTYILEDFIEGGSHRDQLDEATKERIDTAYKEMNEHVGLKWD